MIGTFDLAVRVPGDWSTDRIMQSLAQAVNAACDMNFYWYLGEWDVGNDPKCCPHCAGLKYVPGSMQPPWHVDVAPVLLAQGSTSCESAAAMHTGHKRADAFRQLVSGRPLLDVLWTKEGRRAAAHARSLFTIMLEDTNTPNYWHVVSIDEGERHDATEELDR
jgi:hypothetical protein